MGLDGALKVPIKAAGFVGAIPALVTKANPLRCGTQREPKANATHKPTSQGKITPMPMVFSQLNIEYALQISI